MLLVASPILGAARLGSAPPANRFTLAIDPAALTIAPGGSETLEVTLAPEAGDGETATMTVHGLPAGATGEFSASAAETSGVDSPITLTISVDPAAAPVTLDSFQVRASAPSQTKSRTATLTIPAPAESFTADTTGFTADSDLITADAA